MSNLSWFLLALVIAFFIFVSIRFRKTRLLSNFPYESDEKMLFEEKPIKIEQGSSQTTKDIGITAGGGVSVTSRGQKRTRVMRPWIRVTNKHIIIAQKKEEKPDGSIYTVLSFAPTAESGLSIWWKRGYAVVPITVSEIRAVAQDDGTYMIEILLPSMLPLPGMENVLQTTNIWTSQLSAYEKALNTKIQIRN